VVCHAQVNLSDNRICAESTSIVLIDTIISGSPADAAGMLPGDQLLKINDNTITSFEAVGVHRSSAKGLCRVLRSSREIDISFEKPSADAPLGYQLKHGADISGIIAIAGAIRVSPSLKSINLKRTMLGPEGAKALAPALRDSPSVTSVRAFGNSRSSGG
jgi:membrane-associated protease RseP (regulator of RpoE activity)